MIQVRRSIPVLVVLPPRVLLLDLAGPLEVLRIASAAQDRVTFDLAFAAPRSVTHSSVGLTLGGAGPLPETVEPGIVILVPGSTRCAIGPAPDPQAEAEAEAQIVAWLLADPVLIAMAIPRAPLWEVLDATVAELASLTPAARYASDPDRREELCRLVLDRLGLRPAGETEAQAADRLSSLSGVERRRLLAASAKAEARSR